MKRAGRSLDIPLPSRQVRSPQKRKWASLYLIHYPTGRFAKGDIAAEARKTYKGEVIIAKDFMTIELINKFPSPALEEG